MSSVAKKRKRTVITNEQLHKLEEAFKETVWPNRKAKERLAQQLSKSEHFITVWFQNRRAKWRKEEKLTQLDDNKSDSQAPSDKIAQNQKSGSEKENDCGDNIINRPMQVENLDEKGDFVDDDAKARAYDAAQQTTTEMNSPTSKKADRSKRFLKSTRKVPTQVPSEIGDCPGSVNEGKAEEVNETKAEAESVKPTPQLQKQNPAKSLKIVQPQNRPEKTQSKLKSVRPKALLPEKYKKSPSRIVISGSKVVAVSGPSNLMAGNQTTNMPSWIQAKPLPVIIKTDSQISLQNVTIAESPQITMPTVTNPVSVLRGLTSTGSTVLFSIGPTTQAITANRMAPFTLTNPIQKVSPPVGTTLFHAVMRMLCVAEGGIISKDDPDFSAAATDYLYGIRINGDSRIVYEKYTGLSLVPAV